MNKNNQLIVNKFLLIISILFLVIIIIIFFKTNYIENNCNVKINYNLNDGNTALKHNYILFLDKTNKSYSKLIETNGWLLLEAVLEKSLKNNISLQLTSVIKSFNKSHNGLYGWWPEEIMQKGKSYFLNKNSVQLYYDSDDTAWIYRIYGDFIPESVIKTFLSNEPLPYPFDEVCIEINCSRQHIVRVWSNVDWHDDIDLIGISNFITMLNLSIKTNQNVFETNAELINFIVENENIDLYFKYYEPKITGYFLILFYDDQGPKFLSNKSISILLQRIKDTSQEFDLPLLARWGGGEDWFYGCNIITVNERTPELMREYAKMYWKI